MGRPKVTPEHRELERIVGDWCGQEQVFALELGAEGHCAITRVANRMALDGLAVVQDYMRLGADHLRGHALFRWDPGEECYIMYWFDSLGQGPREFRGNFTGDLLVLINCTDQQYTRATLDCASRDVHYYRMDVSPDGRTWLPCVRAEYVRDAA